MSKKSNYVSTNRSKHYLKCHLILVCKYRKRSLVGDLDKDMKAIMLSITSESDFEIEVFESDLDHIHFLIRYIPRLSVTSIVRWTEAAKHHGNLAKVQKYIINGFLERTYFLVRRLLRQLHG